MKTGASAGVSTQSKPSKQARETHHDHGQQESLANKPRDRWWWVERSVWTKRMLDTLERGVKGGKWFSLIDKVYSVHNLRNAYERVARNRGAAGVDRQSIAQFNRHAEAHLANLHDTLENEHYTPCDVLRRWIDKPGSKDKRPLGIPTVRDRVVQTAVRNVMEPIFENVFHDRSFGFRPGRGCRDALREVDRLLKAGHTWIVDADIKGYFDSIPHDALVKRVEEQISDGRILKLIGQFLKQGIMDEMNRWVPEEGTPQGAVISPLLSNIYLDPLDKRMSEHGFEMIRYADDFVILCRDKQQAQHALEEVRQWMESNKLKLHPEKTRLVDATLRGGFDFLGYHFERGMKWPRKKSEKKLKDTIRKLTKRNNGNSLMSIITNINPVFRGWFGYFKHSIRNIFPGLDSWVRMRLRSILRKRRGGKGRGRGQDHHRWPNAYFERLGLYSVTKAHARLTNPNR
jgi:RNA-directed DNA polymerase